MSAYKSAKGIACAGQQKNMFIVGFSLICCDRAPLSSREHKKGQAYGLTCIFIAIHT
jgi:hypothetical protein